MGKKLAQLVTDERGMETVEWALVAAILLAGAIATIGLLGTSVAARFSALEGATR